MIKAKRADLHVQPLNFSMQQSKKGEKKNKLVHKYFLKNLLTAADKSDIMPALNAKSRNQ